MLAFIFYFNERRAGYKFTLNPFKNSALATIKQKCQIYLWLVYMSLHVFHVFCNELVQFPFCAQAK